MKVLQALRDAGQGRDMSALLARIPFARYLGVRCEERDGDIITVLDPAPQLVGNIRLPAMHGGVVGALLEMTAVLKLLYDTSCESLPRTIDVSFDYLRYARCEPTYGQAIVTRRGRRVANVQTRLWQEDSAKPIALCHGHYLLSPLGEGQKG